MNMVHRKPHNSKGIKMTVCREKFMRKNLVVLRHCCNFCYTEVVSLSAVPEVEVDTASGTWTVGTCDPCPIGGSISFHNVIGVYDRTKINHLTAMVRASQKATQPPNGWDE